MARVKASYFETQAFQNATIKGILLVLCVGLILGVATGCAPTHRSRGLPHAGLVIVQTSKQPSQRLGAIARALMQEMRKDRLQVAFYPQQHALSSPSLKQPRTGAEAANKTLKAAWSAYYDMKFERAWELVGLEMITYPANTPEGLRARLLGALLRFADRKQTKARRLLYEVADAWPSLDLDSNQYPPKFIALYTQVEAVAQKRSNEPLFLPADRPLTALRQSTRHLAQKRRWKQVWLLRVIPQEGMNQAELQEVREGGRRFTQYRSVRFGHQARPEKVASMLWEGRAAI